MRMFLQLWTTSSARELENGLNETSLCESMKSPRAFASISRIGNLLYFRLYS